MKRPVGQLFGWVSVLSFGFFYGSALLRAVLIYYSDGAALARSVLLLALWLLVFLTQPFISRRWPRYFIPYLLIQASIAFSLIFFNPEPSDFFALLYILLSMQVVNFFPPRAAALCIAGFIPLTILSLTQTTPLPMAIALGLLYLAGNALLASFTLASSRATQAHASNQAARLELQAANQRLQEYSQKLERLAITRERSRLARELHDSVTQSIFSLTLAAQSAQLLYDAPAGPQSRQIEEQLARMEELIQGAMSEMQYLISELDPQKLSTGGLAGALRRHLAERDFPEGLSVQFRSEGEAGLVPAEEQALFRIVQESLNNIVKHSGASQAYVQVCLAEPAWIEISDNGRGFEPEEAGQKGGLGLSGMRERAAEIGWSLQIQSAVGSGTRIRLEKPASKAPDGVNAR